MVQLHAILKPAQAKQQIIYINTLDDVTPPAWLTLLGQDHPNLGIWSVGLYNHSYALSFVPSHGRSIAAKSIAIYHLLLEEKNLAQGEIILIGEGLGEFAIKQLLKIASHKSNNVAPVAHFLHRITQIIGINKQNLTPHQATKKGLAQLLSFASVSSRQRKIYTQAQQDSQLQDLNTWYENWQQDKHIAQCQLDQSDNSLSTHIGEFIQQHQLNRQQLWLRSTYGTQLSHWYKSITGSKEKNIDKDYLLSQPIQLFNHWGNTANDSTVVNIIDKVRSLLTQPATLLRLVGHYGVGKTTFAQALFDSSIGKHSLNEQALLYTDGNHQAYPSASHLIQDLIQHNQYAIVIVDNCSPQLHRQLTKICRDNLCPLSLLTIEYDVPCGQQEESRIIHLLPQTTAALNKHLSLYTPHLNSTLRENISQLVQGNIEGAQRLALCAQQQPQYHLDELIYQPFILDLDNAEQQKKMAQLLSLVTHFKLPKAQLSATPSTHKESCDLRLLSQLMDINPAALQRYALNLRHHQLLAQNATPQGQISLVPKALANKIAAQGLSLVSIESLDKIFNTQTPAPLFCAFAQGLAQVHQESKAQQIVQHWLEPDGLIDTLCSAQQYSLALNLLICVAPVCPDTIFTYIENTLTDNPDLITSSVHGILLAKLIYQLALTLNQFSSATDLLCHWALTPEDEQVSTCACDLLTTLFDAQISPDYGTIAQRSQLIMELTAQKTPASKTLALHLLNASLNVAHNQHSPYIDFSSQAHPALYHSYAPQSMTQWYLAFIQLTTKLATQIYHQDRKVKKLISNHFSSLWKMPALRHQLEQTLIELNSPQGWDKGWSALNSIIKYDAADLSKEKKHKLSAISKLLKPNNIQQQIQFYIFSNEYAFSALDITDEQGQLIEHGYVRVQEKARLLGCELGEQHPDYLARILPQLFLIDKINTRLYRFGYGCAQGCDCADSALSIEALWQEILTPLQKQDITQVNPDFITGFIKYLYENDYEKTQVILDKLMENGTINYIFPAIQLGCPLDNQAIVRLEESLRQGIAPASMYQSLEKQLCLKTLPNSKLLEILSILWQRHAGQEVVINILAAYSLELAPAPYTKAVKKVLMAGRQFLTEFNYIQADYKSTESILCEEDALHLFQRLNKLLSQHHIQWYKLTEYLKSLIQCQPVAALNAFTNSSGALLPHILDIFSGQIGPQESPFSTIGVTLGLNWCVENTQQQNMRCISLAKLITPYEFKNGRYQWRKIALVLLDHSPQPIRIFEVFEQEIRPKSWRDTKAKVQAIQERLVLLQALEDHPDALVAQGANAFLQVLQKEIQIEIHPGLFHQ